MRRFALIAFVGVGALVACSLAAVPARADEKHGEAAAEKHDEPAADKKHADKHHGIHVPTSTEEVSDQREEWHIFNWLKIPLGWFKVLDHYIPTKFMIVE